MNAAVLYTGGKDSTYALHLAFLQGLEIRVLASIVPMYEYSMLYHKPRYDLLKLQAESMGFPIEFLILESPDREEEVLYNLLGFLREKYGVEVVVTGSVLSDYQRMRFSMVAEEVGLDVFNPLWRFDQEKYIIELVEHGIEFIIVSINTYGLPPSFMGRVITLEDVYEIIELARKYGFNPSFEGGEAETLVVNAPLFHKKIVVDGEVVEKGLNEYVYLIKNARLS